jgi:hypothetical protein
MNGRIFETRWFTVPWHGDPDSMRDLGSHFVECQRGDEVDNAVRDSGRYGHQVRVAQRRQIGKTKKTARQHFDLSRVSHRVQSAPVDPLAESIRHPQDTAVPTKRGFRRSNGASISFLTLDGQYNIPPNVIIWR